MDVQAATVAGLTVEPAELTPGSSAQSIQTRISSMMQEGVQRLEGAIQQYPWPMVMLGIGFGYLLARRVR
jgi:hypothetical protein